MSCVMCHVSHVICHLPCLAYFLSYDNFNASIFKPQEAKEGQYNCFAEGGQHTDMTTNIVTYRLKRPRGGIDINKNYMERHCFKKKC